MVFGFLSCNLRRNTNEESTTKVEFNQILADELSIMAEVDQWAASNAFPPEDNKHLTQKEWESFKDSIYRTHQKRLEEILNNHGYPGYDLIGKKGAFNFWMITQHSDFNPEFQEKVLDKLKIEVDKENASATNYAYLMDRVLINKGEKQVYGTQLDFNQNICQAFSKNIEDSSDVNKRRLEIGLESLEKYLNVFSQNHFDMNKEFYLSKGINGPKLYEIK